MKTFILEQDFLAKLNKIELKDIINFMKFT